MGKRLDKISKASSKTFQISAFVDFSIPQKMCAASTKGNTKIKRFLNKRTIPTSLEEVYFTYYPHYNCSTHSDTSIHSSALLTKKYIHVLTCSRVSSMLDCRKKLDSVTKLMHPLKCLELPELSLKKQFCISTWN